MRPISARLSQANSAHSGQPVRPSAATNDLFVYGTLALDQVISTLIDRVPAHEPVTAQGWRVARLPDRPYPGLVPDHGQASGRLYTDLTDTEWATLDAFEDPTYTLIAIEVLPGPRPALAYTWPDEHLPGAWTLDGFSATDLTLYLERCGVWRQRYEQKR
ncbi:MAG: gamma-glutamylcyclotransferase family protein [Actinomycetota bacterium]